MPMPSSRSVGMISFCISSKSANHTAKMHLKFIQQKCVSTTDARKETLRILQNQYYMCRKPHNLTSTPRVQRLHSSWHAEIGWILCARLISSAVASEMPRYFTLPSFTSSCVEALHNLAKPPWESLPPCATGYNTMSESKEVMWVLSRLSP